MTETFGRNSSKLLLIVDDDRAYNETVATFLRHRGFKVEQRYDGWEAAVPVAQAAGRRASGRLADTPHRLQRPSYPTGRLRDLYGS